MKKNPSTSALWSFFLPGTGFIYIGHPIHGTIYFACWLASVVWFAFLIVMHGNWWIALLLAGLLWALGIWDSWRMTQRINENAQPSTSLR